MIQVEYSKKIGNVMIAGESQVATRDRSAETETLELDRIRQAFSRRSRGDPSFYSLLNPGHLFQIQEREYEFASMLSRRGVGSLESSRILDVGCGTGYWIRLFLQWGAHPENMFGIDLLPERIDLARKLCPQGVHLECATASALSFPDNSFDLVLQSTVFTSILDQDMKRRVAGEMSRVLKPTGFIVWYDFVFNNPRNPDVRGVRRSEIRKLFPGCQIHWRRMTLAPQLGRIVGRRSPLMYRLLAHTKVLCTHDLCLITKKRQLR